MKRVISTLPDNVMFGMIFFAGPAWPAEDGPNKKLNNWVSSGKTNYGSYRPKDWDKLPTAEYMKATGATRSRARRYVEKTPLVLGTVFDVPIYMALRMDPTPDTVFFMTDGSCGDERGIKQIEKMVRQMKSVGLKVPQINVVGFGVNSNYQLNQIAKLTGGEANYLQPNAYEEQYGKVDKSEPRNDMKPDFNKIDDVAADKYPPQFSFE